MVALVVAGLSDICSECRIGAPREGTCHPPGTDKLSQFPIYHCILIHFHSGFPLARVAGAAALRRLEILHERSTAISDSSAGFTPKREQAVSETSLHQVHV